MTLRLMNLHLQKVLNVKTVVWAVVSVLALVRPVAVVSRVKNHVRAVVYVQVLKVVKLHFTVVCLNSASLAKSL